MLDIPAEIGLFKSSKESIPQYTRLVCLCGQATAFRYSSDHETK